MKWAGHLARIGEMRYAYKILVAKSEWNRVIAISRDKWENNIEINAEQIRYDYLEWFHLAQERVQ
jgi:hypothetical protein